MAAVILVGGGAALYGYVRHAVLEAADGQARLSIVSLLEHVDLSGSTPRVDPVEFEEEAAELHETLDVIVAEVWGSDGNRLARGAMAHFDVPLAGPAREWVVAGGHRLLVYREPLLHQGTRTGTLVVARRADELADDLAALRRGLFLIVPGALLACLAIGLLLSAQSMRPTRQAFDAHRSFMADASHELRTPLAIIRAHAEVALDSGDADSLRAAVETVHRTARSMSGLVDKMLFLARADAFPSTRRRTFDLAALVDDAVESFTPLASRRSLTLAFDAPAEPLLIDADPEALQRLVGILLDNAVRYTERGSIRVSLAERGAAVVLHVEDTGPGMSEELRRRAFERFVRGDPTGKDGGGHGLGLAIARAIVDAHNGTISIESAVAQGTRVTVTLPRGNPQAE